MRTTNSPSRIGAIVPGYNVPVINERAVRAAAGILFLIGGWAFVTAATTGAMRPLQVFGMLFVADMLIRITAGDRWSPAMALGSLAVRGQRPEWVGASQKEFAWWLGIGLAIISCSTMGLFAVPLAVTLSLCGICLSFLFLETAFGICVGCALQSLLGTEAPRYCSGDSCAARNSDTRPIDHANDTGPS